MIYREDVEEMMECRYCGYIGPSWEKMHIRMTVESVETFYICPKCNQAC